MRAMEMLNCLCFGLLGWFLLAILVHAQDQSGFINIDCGISQDSGYTDSTTGLVYTSDATLIDTGVSESISSEFGPNSVPQQFLKLRIFPQGLRNCYTIQLPKGSNPKYLIRARFMYGNYDGKSQVPEFDLHLGPNYWETVKFLGPSYYVTKEIIHIPELDYVQVCVVNTRNGTPLISALEVRPLDNTTYATSSGSLVLFSRFDIGTTTNRTVRYKDDVYDRIWLPYSYKDWTSISAPFPIDTDSVNVFKPPSTVMNTAATPVNASGSLDFFWDSPNTTSQYYVYIHFAEIEKLQANESREFNVSFNGRHWYGPFSPFYLQSTTLYSPSALTTGVKYQFSIKKTENSTLPPIMNALEIYQVNELPQSQTNQTDVDAMMKIKSSYGLKKHWQGDPCAPAAYVWEGLNCSYQGFDPPRIISLNLSSSGLNGSIDPSFSSLTMIQTLDLSNNNLSGPVPDFLSRLPFLTVLNLAGNKLNGSIPVELNTKSKNGSLSLSVEGNPDLCLEKSCKKEKNKFVLPVVASVTSFSVLIVALAILWWTLKGRKQPAVGKVVRASSKRMSSEQKNQQFTYSEVLKITNNFERVLGKGGFGTVYHGYVDDTEVAVKMLSPSSVQGYKQFEAEVKLLMRVHHRNLTTLIGYCDEETNMGLIYEYMANGNLEEHLLDSNSRILSWEERLRIAMDAAQGLEYLHSGCKPPIIHRDVKSTNILLNEKFQAKLADFGLSRIFPTETGAHVSTLVAGTPGYLDPEYYISLRLHERSDVYSFGVVLLELITCQPVISKTEEKTHISQWVSFMLAKGDIKHIVDPRLHGDFEINSVWKAVEIAMACVSPATGRRPSMSHVVMELKDCLAIEMTRTTQSHGTIDSITPIDMFTVNVDTELTPFAR